MGSVKSIEIAVESLPPTELAEFRRWFAEFDGSAWDTQIEQDAASGKLDLLAAAALADYRLERPHCGTRGWFISQSGRHVLHKLL